MCFAVESLLEAWPVPCFQQHKLETGTGDAVCVFVDVCVCFWLSLQRGIPAVSPDVLNQFPAAPVPTLSGFPMPLPATVSQQPLMPAAPPVSMPLSIGPAVMGMSITAPAGGAAGQPSGGFLPPYAPGQVSLLGMNFAVCKSGSSFCGKYFFWCFCCVYWFYFFYLNY